MLLSGVAIILAMSPSLFLPFNSILCDELMLMGSESTLLYWLLGLVVPVKRWAKLSFTGDESGNTGRVEDAGMVVTPLPLPEETTKSAADPTVE